jgi:hypothetical protein
MRPALGYPWDLHIRNSRAYIYRREDRQPIAVLTPAEAVLLGLMDGTRSWAELRDIFVQAVGAPGLEVAKSVESRLRPLLVDGYRRTCPYDLESLAQVHPPNPAEGLRPLPGPRVLHWWVTNYCPRRCIYCFARPILGGQPADATITRAELRKTFREAASLGTENLLVAGAEPFLHDDLPEVMGDALEAGIIPLVTTKFPVSTSLAERLADAGIPHISLSVDTMDEDESLSLIGSREYPEQVRRSVQNLTRVGIAFSIQRMFTFRSVPQNGPKPQ